MTRTTDTLTPPNALQQEVMPPAQVRADTALAGNAAILRWMRVCAVDEIPRLGARVVRRAPGPNVAVFRTAADDLYALADSCPHRGGPLSQGIVFGDRVACPLHNTCVDLDTGCAVAPDQGQVRSYAVKVEAGEVYVQLDAVPDANG